MTKLRVHFAVSLDGYGAAPSQGLDTKVLGYECSEHVTTPSATHSVLTKRPERTGASP